MLSSKPFPTVDAAAVATLTSTYVSLRWDANDLRVAGAPMSERLALSLELQRAEVALLERIGPDAFADVSWDTTVGMSSNPLGL